MFPEAPGHSIMSQLFSDALPIRKAVRIGRRDFLISSAMVAGVLRAQAPKQVRFDQAKLDRIGVMTLSFNSVLKSARHPDDPKRTLDIMDSPRMIADRFGVHHMEFQHSHFASTEPSYLKELRGRLTEAKSHMNQICLEFGILNISSPIRCFGLKRSTSPSNGSTTRPQLGVPASC